MISRKSFSNGRPKDAIALLKADHATVRHLLSQLEETTPRAQKQRKELLARIGVEIRVHARIEEEIFYPAFRKAAKTGEDDKLFFEAAEEHGLVHTFLPRLEGTPSAGDLFGARAKVLKDLVEHHAEEEENELFPRARKLMDPEDLKELGILLADRKADLMNGSLKRRSA